MPLSRNLPDLAAVQVKPDPLTAAQGGDAGTVQGVHFQLRPAGQDQIAEDRAVDA